MSKPRQLALVDVDNTLLFTKEIDEKPNPALIAALSEKKISDIYLFTDMTADVKILDERIKLVAELEAKGFVVSRVITPMDIAWSLADDEKMITAFWKAVSTNQSIKRFTLEDPQLAEILEHNDFAPVKALLDSIKTVGDLTEKFHTLGTAFAELSGTIKQPNFGANDSLTIAAKGYACKLIADLVAQKLNITHVKGVMLLPLILGCNDYQNYFVFDDDQRVITLAQELAKAYEPIVRLSAIQVKKGLLQEYYAAEIQKRLTEESLCDCSCWATLFNCFKSTPPEATFDYKLMDDNKSVNSRSSNKK